MHTIIFSGRIKDWMDELVDELEKEEQLKIHKALTLTKNETQCALTTLEELINGVCCMREWSSETSLIYNVLEKSNRLIGDKSEITLMKDLKDE